jgi:hypothetical protein
MNVVWVDEANRPLSGEVIMRSALAKYIQSQAEQINVKGQVIVSRQECDSFHLWFKQGASHQVDYTEQPAFSRRDAEVDAVPVPCQHRIHRFFRTVRERHSSE